MLKKDQTDIVKPPKVKDDELLYVHTQEYLDGIQVRILINLSLHSHNAWLGLLVLVLCYSKEVSNIYLSTYTYCSYIITVCSFN